MTAKMSLHFKITDIPEGTKPIDLERAMLKWVYTHTMMELNEAPFTVEQNQIEFQDEELLGIKKRVVKLQAEEISCP